MIRIPGVLGKDLCDSHLGMSRRDVLRVGGSGLLGLSLGGMFELRARAAKAKHTGGPGWGKAKVIGLTGDDDEECRRGSYEQFMRDDEPEDAIYDKYD